MWKDAWLWEMLAAMVVGNALFWVDQGARMVYWHSDRFLVLFGIFLGPFRMALLILRVDHTSSVKISRNVSIDTQGYMF